jgi:hypothetical protein
MRCSITLRQFAKGAQTTFGAVAKGKRSPFMHFAYGIRKLHAFHAKPNISATYRWDLIRLKQNGSELKIMFTIHGFYSTTFRLI